MHSCTLRKIVVFVLALMFLAAARQASAELIFFASDRSMSVKAHRFEGDSIIVTLRSGGEMTFDRSLITKIGPDEVPYDEPATLAAEAAPPDNDANDANDAPPQLMAMATTTYDTIIKNASARHGVR